MGDNGGGRRTRWHRSETDESGAEQRAESLRDLVPQGYDTAYTQLGDAFPEQLLRLQVLHSASQRAFEPSTSRALRRTLRCVLRSVLRDPRLGDSPPSRHVGEYLDEEITGIRARLGQDRAVAVSRGLNVGLGVGAAVSVVLLCLPLLWGARLLEQLTGATLGCTDRWSLLGAFVCGGVGAFGAVLSVLVRLRNSGDELTRRKVNGHDGVVAPGELYRTMRHEGVYRVFVGWILALAVYFLLGADFVTFIETPATPARLCSPGGRPGDGTDFWGFWCAVGFVAGFNERWAYGLLGRATAPRKDKP
ncbi:hypothetical protein ACFS5L_05010 [Streptomyces phyllanthi]|uniref:Uncharacterized protein n=1 Tax=Streptomyces phyllanthi TaxID=1803180 RepID=A0A5N8W3H2_9ACTN|nr:hypothetical protein [Streptomyces phyllanthi]MPY42043.1 hypothetical protein [Streptomyces phyllanthi]